MKKIFILAILTLLISPIMTLADLGPKPSISLKFSGPNSSVSDIKFIECDNQDCTIKRAPNAANKQNLSCTYGRNLSCYSISVFGQAKYLQLEATVSNKKVYSNIFSAGGSMDSYFNVIINKDNLAVEKITEVQYEMTKNLNNGQYANFISSFIITIIIELLIGLIYLLIKKTISDNNNLNNNTPKIVLFWILLINLITLPLLWVTSNYININYYIFTLIAELVVIMLESIFIFIVMKKTIPHKELLLLSLVMNAASFFLGNYILKIIG